MAAGQALEPAMMIVQQHENMLDDNSPLAKEWYVADGVCGFAWVKVRPANSAFVKWVVASGKTRKGADYDGGKTVKWVGEFRQSMQKKEAYANAFAKVLQQRLGINAHSMSRMD